MLFCSVAFSVVVKRLILYVTYQKQSLSKLPALLLTEVSLLPDEQLWASSLGSQDQCVIQAFCAEELQCLLQAVLLLSSSPPSPLHLAGLGLCLQLGTESCWHCQPSKQPGHFFSLWCLSLSRGLIAYFFLSPCERAAGMWVFLYICYLIWSGSELLCAHNLWVECLGWGLCHVQWDDTDCCCLGQHRVTKFSCHLGFLQRKFVWSTCSLFPPSHSPIFAGTPCFSRALSWNVLRHCAFAEGSAWNLGSVALLSPAGHTSSLALAETLSIKCVKFC